MFSLINDLKANKRDIAKIKKDIVKIDSKIATELGISIHCNVALLREYFEKIMENRIDIFFEIKRAIPLYDPSGFFVPMKSLVEKGEIKGTKEALFKLITEVRVIMRDIERIKVNALSDIYSAVIDAAEGALMARGISFFVPKELPELLDRVFLKEKKIGKKTIEIFKRIYSAYKDYEHEEKMISGKELDGLLKAADFFIDEMQRVAREEMAH
ncbi:MAG: hypothetical protein QXJ92_02120 [Candidatus Pacearchaeota archaeon]